MSDLGSHEPIDGVAIIGMAGRFPKARSVDELWRNLRDGVESVSFFSDEELIASGIDPALLAHPDYVKAKAVLEDAELFDASFFGFNPREAQILDPQQRVFLECAWEALESAGYDPETHPGAIGVYGGMTASTYLLSNLLPNRALVDAMGRHQLFFANDKDYITTRVSYKLNLKGPSVDVQSACSTSLLAVQLACQSLLTYQCDMALAGGASIGVPRKNGYLAPKGLPLSPDGHCRAFDVKAQGTFYGEGVGIVVLKRLAEALADGDRIHAVIRGAAVNNDGSLKVGFTAPSVDRQAEVIALAQAIAGVDAETVTYVEAHGTATALGDPIEVAALTRAFRASTGKTGFCAIGSLKTNIGHLDAAAGVASLIKTVMALEHKEIPASLHFEAPNPEIDFANSPFYVNRRLAGWKRGATPRRAGVNSFGIGGTNVHIVLEEAPAPEPAGAAKPSQLLVLSAQTGTALEAMTANLVAHLEEHHDLELADVAYTLQVGRRSFGHRRMVVCRGLDDAVAALKTLDPGRVRTADPASNDQPVAFMFPGQGSQYVNMARELYQVEPTFRRHVDRCAELLEPHLGLDLRGVLFPTEDGAAEATRALEQTQITQPALFVIEYALAELFIASGVRPQAMIGHSIGEYVAACLAGVFSLDDALALVAARGRFMQQMPRGAMLAVPLPEHAVRPLLGETVSLAAINGPSMCVVSGPTTAVEALQARLAEGGVSGRRLHTSHAYHSGMMEPVLRPFAQQLGRIKLAPPEIPFVSNVTGTWITAEQATDPGYWARHLRETVRFAGGMGELLAEPHRVLLEVGPGHTLSSLVRQLPGKAPGQVVLSSLRHPEDTHSDAEVLLTTLGRLWLAGARVDWSGLHAGERRRRIPLPTYPFERRRYWIEEQPEAHDTPKGRGPLRKRSDIGDWFYVPSWKRSAPPKSLQAGTLASQKLSWLLFTDECGLGRAIASRLEKEGQDVTTVTAGERFHRESDGVYTIDPGARDDYGALLGALHGSNKLPQMIVHLWSVTPAGHPPLGLAALDASQGRGFYSLLFLAQALGELDMPDPLRIEIISNNVQEVTGDEVLCPEKATVLGPCKVIPQEFPNITCRSIDVVLPESGSAHAERLISQLLAEVTAKPSDRLVAYRGTHRWVESVAVNRLDGAGEGTPGLREGGVYLITGGLGGIGLVLAEHLARTVRAKLALIGRSPLPERHAWGDWLATHDEQDRVSRRIRALAVLEELGAEVLVLSADVANLEEMREAIERTRARFGAIHGVIHAAGIAGGGMIQLKTPQIAAGVLSPKVTGTVVLQTLLSDVKLDLFVLCSSINSILAGFGQVDYCGANAFLDAFARHHNGRSGTRVVSINWDAWQEVGMAVDTEVPAHLQGMKEENLRRAILPAEGTEAFDRILDNPLPQVIVSTRDLELRFERSGDFTVSSFGEELEPGQGDLSSRAGSSALHPRPKLQNAYVAPRTELERIVVGIWQKLLGIDQVGVFDNFFELGGHSLLGAQIISHLQQALQVNLPLRTLFEAATVAELAERLETLRWAAQSHQTASSVAETGREEIEL